MIAAAGRSASAAHACPIGSGLTGVGALQPPAQLNGEPIMAKIIRTDPGAILSKAVEYHNFVYLPGITARDGF